MMKICKLALIALAFVAGVEVKAQTPAPAPTPAPGVPAEDQGLRIRGLSFQLGQAPVGDVFAHDDSAVPGTPGSKLDVKNYLNHEFSVLPFRGKNITCTKSSDPGSVKDPASILAKATLPDGFKQGIFMFLPGTGAAGAPTYRVLVIDDSTKAFPRGSVRILNLSRANVRIQLEKETFDFKSGEMKNVENPPADATQNVGVRAFSQVGTQWQKITTGIWPHPGDRRTIQIVYENPASKKLEVKGIRDVVVEY